MTALADRRVGFPGAELGARIAAAVRVHRRSLWWLLPLLAVAGTVSAINLGGAPQRIDDEGTYTAQAWAVSNLGTLAHYTFWYDHPPLGWIQMALYGQVTGAFARYSIAVVAMREAMVVASLISVVLVWVLARRLTLSRPAAAAAGLLFAVSPLALQFHRTVYLDNVATPWLLGALILALSRRNQLAAFTGSALMFGIAVLSKETYLLALPLLVFLAARSAAPETRRYTLAVSGSVLALVTGSYLLLAAVKGELLPRSGQVSLLDGVTFQLATRAASGSPFDPQSLTNRTLSRWWQLDAVFIVAALLASVAALAVRRLRPYAVFTLAAVLFAFRPGGYIPVPYVIMLLPFGALLVAAVVDGAARSLAARRRRVRAVGVLAVALAAAVAVVPLWTTQLRGFLNANLDEPMSQAQAWVGQNVPHQNRIIVDDAMWVDLVRQGRERSDVIWYYKLDTDPAVARQSPDGWRDSDYIVTTDSMRSFPDAFPQVQKAIDNSVVVASYGTGLRRVDVRQIQPAGLRATAAAAEGAQRAAADAGTALAGNPR
ncbi:MAG: glycosyltransferase family 39 protein, partial [Micrococcales bacterium]|nr:glycosyltransferase family 39 protein [Micrococcales bacterium]